MSRNGIRQDSRRCALAAAALPCALLWGGAAWPAYPDDVGYTALQAELGAATPTGAGVTVSQVEAAVTVNGVATWMPDVTSGDFAGKTLTSVTAGAPAGTYSGHATAVGAQFYGNAALARGVDTIDAYDADHWAGGDFLWTSGLRQPGFSTSRVVNHSWIGDAGAANGEVLRRLDWVIETDDMVHVVGLGNGGGASTAPLLASAFNTIAVGRTDGATQVGSVAVDSTYVAGRVRPDVVAPGENTSLATARVSAAVALLVEAGHADPSLSTDPLVTSYTNRAGLVVRNAERVEVIRAALMAGADRLTRNTSTTNLGHYRDVAANQSANGLDYRYGAGQLDVYDSYRILASGEQNSVEDGGPGSGAATRGFDYDPGFGGNGGTNAVATYPLPVSAQPQLLTAALAWNLHVNGGTLLSFSGNAYARNLDLEVVDLLAPGGPATVWASQGTADNTENAWLVVPPGASYALRVTRPGTSFNHDYGIAWQLLPDADADGAPDGRDDCMLAPNGPLVPDEGGNVQLDADGDGYGNLCDGDLDQSGLVSVIDFRLLRTALNQPATASPLAAAADLDGNGLVTVADYAILKQALNKPPGPSAFAP